MKNKRYQLIRLLYILILGVCVMGFAACQKTQPDTASNTNSNQATNSAVEFTGTLLDAGSNSLSVVDMKLSLAPTAYPSQPPQYQIELNGTQTTQPLSGIAIRLLFDNADPSTLPTKPFIVPTNLLDAGWTIAINGVTDEQGKLAAELALINTKPQGILLSDATVLGMIQTSSSSSLMSPRFDQSLTQVVTKSAQAVPLNFIEPAAQ